MNDTRRFLCRLTVGAASFCALAGQITLTHGQWVEKHQPLGIASDWTHHHVLYPYSGDRSQMFRVQNESRWVHSWYIRHPEAWWPEGRGEQGKGVKRSKRDWSFPLGTAAFQPAFDFSFTIGAQTGYGSLTVADQGNGQYLAKTGNATVTGSFDVGSYALYPGGPGVTNSPSGSFTFDNLLFASYPTTNPSLDGNGLLFRNSSAFEVNIWGNGASAYEYDDTGYTHDITGSTFTLNLDPGGGQTTPAKFVFDVTAAPSCANDYVAIGIPSAPVSGGQANILGVNNLYTGASGFCTGAGPTVKFAYASGSGGVPADLVLSQDGSRLAYVETRLTGSSYFHVLTIGTTGNNGTSATAAVVPGTGNNAVDSTVLLSPDGGVTNQSSTNSVFVVYTTNEATDVAYATTYSARSGGSGYLYKLKNVFGAASPAIVWSLPINAIPSTPVYDSGSNKIFFTDSVGRIDYVIDSGVSPSVVYGSVVANGATSENPVVIDSTNQMVYASFNSNGTKAIIVQAPTSMASTVSVPVGTASTAHGSPYTPDFNNAFYTGSGTALMYVAGTGTGTLPTLYSIGFDASGHLKSSTTTSTALATGLADSSPVTEFYNAALHKDYLFVGVTNHCKATTLGGTAGCVMSLDITAGFPTVAAGTTALAASGGTTGIIVDNDSSVTQASSIYYATKSGSTLVKATQSGLN
jgi:hypothetical protein